MKIEDAIRRYNEAIIDTDRPRALEVVREAVREGATPEDVVFKIVLPAMDEMVRAVSESFEVNLAQHFLTSRIADAVTAEMLPRFASTPGVLGKVVIGTAQGDFHTLGKRIVMGCLRARMIEVVDLGVNLPAERFVEGALEHGAQVIGISALMVHTATSDEGCRRVRQLLEERGLRDRLRIIVGGAPFRFHPDLYLKVGADAWAATALEAPAVVGKLLEEVRR